MSESKKHHYVPQSVLRGFAIPNTERVYVFDKKSLRVYESAIGDAAAENQYNTLDVDGRRVNLEPAFDGHDSRLAELLRKLRDARELSCLTDEDRHGLAYAAVVQRLRVRLVRSTLSSLPEQLRSVFEEADAEFSPDIAPDLDNDHVKALTFRLLREADRYVPAFLNKHWLLHTTTETHPFFTSDSPIVADNILPWGDTGLESRGVELAWPISSSLTLSFLCPSMSAKLESLAPSGAKLLRSSPTIHANENGVLFYNSLQVLQSSRFLYGVSGEFRHAREILEENPSARHIETNMQPTAMGEAPPSRMPPGRWLVVIGARTHHCLGVESWEKRGRQLHITVPPDWREALQSALGDGPHEMVQLFDDQGPSWVIRRIELGVDPRSDRTVVVTHDGAPL